MWIFDGEQWIREGAEQPVPAGPRPELEVEPLVPELQVIEIPITRRKDGIIPPFPTA